MLFYVILILFGTSIPFCYLCENTIIMNKLINISEATSIAIHSLALISKVDYCINASIIAKLSGFSKNHLSKVLQVLVKHDYLKSNRGPKGGFELIKDVNKISLMDIYIIFEGNVSNDNHKIQNELCPFEDQIFQDIVKDLSAQFIKSFTNRTIADIKWNLKISPKEYFGDI